MSLSRRKLLIGALVGGGLAVGYVLRPRDFALPLEPGRDEVAFDAWIKIANDGVVTVAVPQVEMGQGVTTLLPQVAAYELGADWRQVAVEPVPVSGHYANYPLAARWAELWMPAWPGLADATDSVVLRRWAENSRFTVTAEGTALEAYELPIREAAASVRAMLAMAAAERWDVAWEECRAEGGFIINGEQRASFGELAESAAAFDPPETPPLLSEPPSEDPATVILGGALEHPRLDLPSKVDGTHLFAADVRLPDMLYAAIRHGPIGKATLSRYDKAEAEGTPGLVSFIKGESWLAAVATDTWAAERALAKVAPSFTVSRRPSSEQIDAALEEALLKGDAATIHETGEARALLADNFDLARRYEVAPAAHGSIETTSATARFADGRLELWMGTQAPEAARQEAADALGISTRDVVLYPVSAGGSFDRRLEIGHAAEVALIAREAGRPVQLTWSRWQEHLAGWPRPPVAALMGARIGASGSPIAWRARIAVPAAAREFGMRLFNRVSPATALAETRGAADPMAVEGAIPPYAMSHVWVSHAPAALDLPSGRMRGNAHGYTCFFNECFMDELARSQEREPLSYRMALLAHDPRLAECLQRAAALASWDGGAASSGQGLACHVMGPREAGGRIAVIASARVGERGLTVDKLSAAVDIGRVVNLDIARQQIEGGLIFGLGLAVGSGMGYRDGLPTANRLSDLAIPRLADCPQIEVEIVKSDAPPFDPGELAMAPVAPAIANALFSATGLRSRRLPLLSDAF